MRGRDRVGIKLGWVGSGYRVVDDICNGIKLLLIVSCLLAAIFWAIEADILRGELGGIALAKSRVLSKVLPDGRKVSEVLKPGSVTIVKENEVYYICGLANMPVQLRDGL